MYVETHVHQALLSITFIVLVAKLVPVGYGIMKLQITCVVEDDKVSNTSCVFVTCVHVLCEHVSVSYVV